MNFIKEQESLHASFGLSEERFKELAKHVSEKTEDMINKAGELDNPMGYFIEQISKVETSNQEEAFVLGVITSQSINFVTNTLLKKN